MNATVQAQPAAAAASQQDGPSLVLEEVVLDYPHLFQPWAMRGSNNTPKYQCVVVLPLGFDVAPLQRLASNAAVKVFGSDAMKLLQNNLIKNPFRKQMEKALQGTVGYSDDPAALFFTAASERPPGVVDANLQPIVDPDKVYGGVIANVQVNCFAWNHPTGGRGLSFGLQNVQIVRDGPRTGAGNPDPRQAFKPLPGANGAAASTGADLDQNVRNLFL